MENNTDRQFTAIRTMKDKIREKNNKQKKLKKKMSTNLGNEIEKN